MMPIGFAVVGYGRMGKRHASLIGSHPETVLRAVADPYEKGPGENSSPESGPGEISGPPVAHFDSLDSLLESPLSASIDVVDIATPNGYHAVQACRALEAGKHVIVEKPLALTGADARRIIETGVRMDKRVFVVMQNRYASAAHWLHSLVSGGRLGKIFLVQVNAFWNRDGRYYVPGGWHGRKDLDGGVLFTQFSHLVDLLYWLFGDLSDIRSRWADFTHKGLAEFQDSGMVQFSLKGGAMGAFHFSTAVWDKNLDTSLTLVAEYGTIRLGGQYMERVDYCHLRDGAPPPETGHTSLENHRLFFSGVVDVLQGRAEQAIDPMDGWKVVDLIERFYKA
ncbi:Gfo/Idh/MocA family protein [Dinghuibacter silviterrae]|uniref:Putative dehydrogenase n=1 Tax=Dinghuibacter silviterrae TaxID=1539049 RepID=A0A4R8DQG9_9BACT|nr:Gfo/Idh/MocA family oxidoreductase [Dinghuibacter silviterrae]TDX00028.1 putative dehydrogenase [Dinghuibacter silviterrae]